MSRRGQRYDSDDDAGMNEGRAPAQESGAKRQATDSVTTPLKKPKEGTAKTRGEEKRAKEQRKQEFQKWLDSDAGDIWMRVQSCLVYRSTKGTTAWATGAFNDSDQLKSERKATIDTKWNNVCYSEDCDNPSENPGKQAADVDLRKHGHLGLFYCNSAGKWACHVCKQYGYFRNSK